MSIFYNTYVDIIIILSFISLPSVFLGSSLYLYWFQMSIETHMCDEFDSLLEI